MVCTRSSRDTSLRCLFCFEYRYTTTDHARSAFIVLFAFFRFIKENSTRVHSIAVRYGVQTSSHSDMALTVFIFRCLDFRYYTVGVKCTFSLKKSMCLKAKQNHLSVSPNPQ